jgi:uncharacterized protein (TIGR02145 family)
MKKCFSILLTFAHFVAGGQIQQNINKIADTISNEIHTIDSIRFDAASASMEVVLRNGTVTTHSISEILHVNFKTANQHSCGDTNVHNPSKTYGTLTDQQGNVYKTIMIGQQEWMAENLKTSIYRNGDAIANVIGNSQWQSLTAGAWAFYNHDSQFECPYGKFYNWYAVTDPRRLCPAGWHVPANSEWVSLLNYLGGNSVAGGKMKTIGTQDWSSPNQGASNESGFSGLPGGVRYANGSFNFIGRYGRWWSNSQDNIAANAAFYLELDFNGNQAISESFNKRAGMSVRCVKD